MVSSYHGTVVSADASRAWSGFTSVRTLRAETAALELIG